MTKNQAALSSTIELKTIVVVPAFNESKVIRTTIMEILARGLQVIIVDDSSTDDTHSLLSDLPIHYLRHCINLGQGASLQTGIEHAIKLGMDYIVTFDADGQHDPDDIIELVLCLIHHNLDIVFGSRFIGSVPKQAKRSRIVLLKIARWINFAFSGLLLSDAHNGLRVLTSGAASKIRIRQNRMSHATEIMMEVKLHNMKFGECKTNVRYTDYSIKKGQKNIDALKVLKEIILCKIFR